MEERDSLSMSSCFRTSPIITPAAGELRTPNAERDDSVFLPSRVSGLGVH